MWYIDGHGQIYFVNNANAVYFVDTRVCKLFMLGTYWNTFIEYFDSHPDEHLYKLTIGEEIC